MTLQPSQNCDLRRAGPTIDDFEALAIDAQRFDHQSHVFVAWSYLREYDLLVSIARYRSTLRRLTRKLGVPGKYHETITWFFMVVVAERIDSDPAADWDVFVEQNQDLFASPPGILGKFYSSDRLDSAAARRQFLLPDLLTL